jgi:hypothetical protein
MVIWADALCINPKDELERGHQVKLMGDIYWKASKVRAWLGLGTHIEERGLRVMHHMSQPRCTNASRDPTSLPHDMYSQPWEEGCEMPFVCAVYNAPYWRRVWTIQELVLNENIILHSGIHQKAVKRRHYLKFAIFSCVSGFGSSICPSAFTSYSELSKTFSSPSSAKLLTEKQHKAGGDVLEMLNECRTKLVTNDLDRIYRILGLLERYLDITPDYLKTADALFEDVTIRLLERAGSLDI